MKSQILARGAGVALAALLALAAYGCSKKTSLHSFIPNQRPTVVLTSGPISARDTVSFSISLRWTADDPDGRVDHFEYALDPGDHDTTWVSTTDNKLEERFSSRDPLPPVTGVQRTSVQTHTFVIRAFDNQGLGSALNTRSFTSSTISPTVSITSPLGSKLIQIPLPPTTHIEWQGDDPDGVTSRKPTYYMWKLFKFGNTEFDYNLIKSNPDSLRRFYAKTNFATWDTVPGPRGVNSFVDLPTEHSPNLELGKSYMFVVVAFDTAKAYSPVFSYDAGGNMLEFQVGFAGNLGPPITAFNDFFFYRMVSGGLAITELNWVKLEVPAARPVTFNWTVEGGSRIQWYRWRINGDWQDEDPRTNEATDWYHWSAPSSGTTSCTFGPFPGDTVMKKLMIEAMDANGLFSILTIAITPVVPTFAKNLLIVDDCRPEADRYTAAGALMPYTQFWPSATELDTFLYARGGVPWRGTLVSPSAPVQPISRPGLFAGYSFDTLGTRQGIQIASAGVPLSTLGKYKNLIWMVDKNGGANTGTPIDLSKPTGTLHWMCTQNHQNTLGSYMTAGGNVWLLGGDAAFASMREFNAKGAANNDSKYLGISGQVYSGLPPANELVPGRLMYGGAHWRSEMITHVATVSSATLIKSPRVPSQPWTSPGWNYTHPISSPNYACLPTLMRQKSPAIGDTLPPTRTNQFFGAVTYDVEYLTQPNEIIEDYDPSPFTVQEAPALDTLMDVSARSGLAPTGNEAAVMTYYHGVEAPEFIFTGFNFWSWNKNDCKQLVDFVLQEIWKMPPPTPMPTANQLNAQRSVPQSPAASRPASTPPGAWSRLPSSRTGGR